MTDHFEELMRNNDPARGITADPARRNAVLAVADTPEVTDIATRRPMWGRRLAVAASLIAVTGGVVVAQGALAPRPSQVAVTTQQAGQGAAPEAAVDPGNLDQVLELAATKAVDPATKPGQYWKITMVEQAGQMTQGGADTPEGSKVAADDYSVCLTKGSRDTYAAVDGASPSYFAESAQKKVKQLAGSAKLCTLGQGAVWTTNLSPNDKSGSWSEPTPKWIDSLPTDVKGLRAKLYSDAKTGGNAANYSVMEMVADSLRSGMMPARVRTLLFQVLKTIPGAKVTDQSVSINGRTGVAIGLDLRGRDYQDVVVDPKSGELLGTRNVWNVAKTKVVGWSTYSRTLVDAIPADVKSAARHDVCTPDGMCKEG